MNQLRILLVFMSLFMLHDQCWSQANIPPNIEAEGNQLYCPLSEINIVTSFNITDPDDIEIEALHIQISTGYVSGQDQLSLTGVHPNIIDTWDILEGKLSLRGAGGANVLYTDLVTAVNDVVFSSNSESVNGVKLFSFTVGDANYLPSTDHYYQYIPDFGITWTEARIAAETYTYFGLQGYLATITSPEEAQLSGEQAAGTGWIGGSDEDTEGVWKWMTGPEAGTVFWNGGINGSSPNYANWNSQEPNNLGGFEHYAHVTAPGIGNDGSWNDLGNTGELDPNSDYHPRGFIVEYGGTPGDPVVDISASTSITIPDIESTVSNERCGEGSVFLEAIPTEASVLWFDAPMGGSQIGSGTSFTTPFLTSSTTYYALASSNGCTEGMRYPVTATILELPLVESSIVLQNCDEDGISDGFADFNLLEAEDYFILENSNDLFISYHLTLADANSNENAIDGSSFNNSISNLIYARIQGSNGCHEITNINLQVSTTSFPDGYMQEIEFCDDGSNDGFFQFDLDQVSQSFIDEFPGGQNLSVRYFVSSIDAHLEQNEISATSNYTNEIPYQQVLYVRVESNDNGICYGIGPHLTLKVNAIPEFEIDQSSIFCLNGDPILLEVFDAQGVYTYEWTDENGVIVGDQSSVSILDGGVYTVIATSLEGCISEPVLFNVVESDIASINESDISIQELSNNNTISINNNNLGIGDYEFALDNGPFQNESFFSSVSAGTHVLNVRDKNGCGTVQIEVFVLGFPKYFTPNNDGYHDTWNIKGWSGNYVQNSSIHIFDRYGKLLKQILPWSDGWNGTFNGQELSASDYWFVANLVDQQGVVKVLQGHFSLVR